MHPAVLRILVRPLAPVEPRPRSVELQGLTCHPIFGGPVRLHDPGDDRGRADRAELGNVQPQDGPIGHLLRVEGLARARVDVPVQHRHMQAL